MNRSNEQQYCKILNIYKIIIGIVDALQNGVELADVLGSEEQPGTVMF